MGVRDCAFDGCNALEFRTSEYCLRHNALFLVSNKKRRAEWRRRTREKNKQRWEKRKPRLRELADSVFASVSNFVVDLDTGELKFSSDGVKWFYEKSLTRQYHTIEAEMLQDKKNHTYEEIEKEVKMTEKERYGAFNCRGCGRSNRLLSNRYVLCDSCQEHSDY